MGMYDSADRAHFTPPSVDIELLVAGGVAGDMASGNGHSVQPHLLHEVEPVGPGTQTLNYRGMHAPLHQRYLVGLSKLQRCDHPLVSVYLALLLGLSQQSNVTPGPSGVYQLRLIIGTMTPIELLAGYRNPFDHPPGPLSFGELRTGSGRAGVRFVAEVHSQTPGEGVSPLFTPHSVAACWIGEPCPKRGVPCLTRVGRFRLSCHVAMIVQYLRR